MRFDDRLKTAIMQPVVDAHDRIVRWRQVVDLLSRLPEEYDEGIVDAGFALVERDAVAVPEDARAATARAIANRTVTYRIAALFARDRLPIAAPLLASANLGANEWARIARDSSPEVAAFIDSMVRAVEHRTVPVTEAATAPVLPADPEQVDEATMTPSIGQMVARIEELRRRKFPDAIADMPLEPEITAPVVAAKTAVRVTPSQRMPSTRPKNSEGIFRWESDASGQIAWVDGMPRGALVGDALRDLAANQAAGQSIDAREPFDGAVAEFDVPAMEGEWTFSGIPAFSPRNGRFLGYRGVARRRSSDLRATSRTASAPVQSRAKHRDLESLRETIHEIKTPLNAIIGFAEIIDGQYLGPAHRNYRQRAAGIVAQARTLLEAIDDLEIAVRHQAASPEKGSCDIGAVLNSIAPGLVRKAERAAVTLSIAPVEGTYSCAVDEEVATRLLARFLGGIIEAGGNADRIMVEAEWNEDAYRIGVTRPIATIGMAETLLMDPAYRSGTKQESILGLGFVLRLVRGLARLCGGDVEIEPDKFVLRLPAG